MTPKPDNDLRKRLAEAVKLLRNRKPTAPLAFAMGFPR